MLSDLELTHLRLLLEVREVAKSRAREFEERLEDFVLELREHGASTRSIAEALGLGPSTIQGWIQNATRRRGVD
jgi:transposase